MSQLKNQLIKLGYRQPELRQHIRPVLDTLCGKSRNKKAGKDIYFKQLNPEAQRVLSEEILEVASQYAAEKGRPLPTPGKVLMGFERGKPYTLEVVREMIKDLEYEQGGFSPFLSKFDEVVEVGSSSLWQIDRRAAKKIAQRLDRLNKWRKKALRYNYDSDIDNLLRKAEQMGAEQYLEKVGDFLESATLEKAQNLMRAAEKFERLYDLADDLFDQDKYINPVQGTLKDYVYPAERYLKNLDYVGGYLIENYALDSLK